MWSLQWRYLPRDILAHYLRIWTNAIITETLMKYVNYTLKSKIAILREYWDNNYLCSCGGRVQVWKPNVKPYKWIVGPGSHSTGNLPRVCVHNDCYWYLYYLKGYSIQGHRNSGIDLVIISSTRFCLGVRESPDNHRKLPAGRIPKTRRLAPANTFKKGEYWSGTGGLLVKSSLCLSLLTPDQISDYHPWNIQTSLNSAQSWEGYSISKITTPSSRRAQERWFDRSQKKS